MKRSGGMLHHWTALVSVAGMTLVIMPADPVAAGAWNQPKGQGQVIVKYEPVWSVHRFDEDGDRLALPDERQDYIVSLWGEYGLSERVTLLVKTDWQDTDDGFHQYRGMGPVEIGGRWQALDHNGWQVSVQASYISDTHGRNAAWGSAGEGEQEADLRVLAGRNFGGRFPGFYEVQMARRWRDNLANEVRAEGTLGVHFRENYTAMAQFYAGKADVESDVGGARWLTLELGVVRHWEDWSVQAGWRATTAGRNVPAADGPIVALWKRF